VRDDALETREQREQPERIRNKLIVPVRGAEDGEGIQHLVGATDQGKSYLLAPNELDDSGLAGPAFSSDGSMLFASIQSPGYVLAITGPWGRPATPATDLTSTAGSRRTG
jgi:secreted PhoX family phosphatase